MLVVEIFAGAGGLALAAEKAGFKHVLLIERDKWCCKSLRDNLNNHLIGAEVVETDIRDHLYSDLTRIDLLTGGPPCQPFSMGGKHKAYDDERDLFPEAVRAIRALKPKAFMFENVKGLTRQSFSNYFEYIRLQMASPALKKSPEETWEEHLRRLEREHTHGTYDGLSYRVVTRILNAADYGVPQKRERVFFVGTRSDLHLDYSFPEPTHSQEALIIDKAEGGTYWQRHNLKVMPEKLNELQRKRLEAIAGKTKPWATVRDALSGLPDPELAPKQCQFDNHLYIPGARIYKGHTGSPLDEPSKTLKAGAHGVPGGENMMVRTDGSVRYFTIRESARLQTFPDNYRFHGSWGESMRQLGNAVPVDLAAKVLDLLYCQLRESSLQPT